MNRNRKTEQIGSVLLEVMISILIFSFGVLGIIGLQANMIKGAAEARYRSEAGFFANRLLGEINAADRSSAAALSAFLPPSGAKYTTWYDEIKNTDVSAGLLGLPGAATTAPTVTITPFTNITGFPTRYDVTVSLFWQSPGQPQHRHVVSTSISAD